MLNAMYYEEKRLNTFKNKWPHKFINEKVLAKSGFFYTGEFDKVQCAFCNVELHSWTSEDNEVIEHMRWSPNCSLLRRVEIKNVPLDPIELNELLPSISHDECGIYKPAGLTNQSLKVPETVIKSTKKCSLISSQTSKSSSTNRHTETIFYMNNNKSVAFVFGLIGDKRDKFKLQNMESDEFIFLDKPMMTELFATTRNFFNINISHTHCGTKSTTEKIVDIFLVNQNTCKIKAGTEYLYVQLKDLASITDFELFMPFLYINYLD